MDPLESSLTAQIICLFLALSGDAITSFLETSITAVKFFELRVLSKRFPRYQKLLNTLETSPHKILVPILIVGSLTDVITAALLARLFEELFARLHLSQGLGFSIGCAFASFLLMLFGEIIPKNFARARGSRYFASTLWLTNAIVLLLSPFTRFLAQFANVVITIFNKGGEPGVEAFTSEQELRFLIDYVSEKNLIEPEKSSMLQNIFSIGNKTVRDILVPENQMVTINSTATLGDALKSFVTFQYSRLPVYQEDKEDIIGILYQKDIFLKLQEGASSQSVKDFLRPVLFVPESMKINQLLKEFRGKSLHMAIALSEHGEIAGLVTLEDVLEEIVGEIRDEHEMIVDKVINLPNGGMLIDARINLDELGKLLNTTFEAEDAVTLSGFLTEKLQHLPKKGERLLYNGYFFQIHQATIKQVQQVLVFKESSPLVDQDQIIIS